MPVETLASPMVNDMLTRMTLAEKIGQMLIVDFGGVELTTQWRSHLQNHHIGGVILFAKNVQSAAQVRDLCADLQTLGGEGRPLFISIDQEGGIVNRLQFDEAPLSPGNMALGAAANDDYVYQTSLACGAYMRALGINLNFAPCVDVNNNAANPIIGIRSFGESPERVSRYGTLSARGYRDAGMLPCAKHFPGHGDTALDSHLQLQSVAHERPRLDEVELAPFRALIDENVEMIMTAHIVFPALDAKPVPATLSAPILTGLLRRDLGFNGVIITDSMSMHAIAGNYGAGPAAVASVLAGADIVLACGELGVQVETAQALLAAAESGQLPLERIDDAVRRILSLKEWLARQPPPRTTEPGVYDYMRQVARAGITLVKNEGQLLPLRPGRRTLLLSPTRLPVSPNGEIAAAFPLASLLGKAGVVVSEHTFDLQQPALDTTALQAALADADVVVACLYARGRLSGVQLELAELLRASNKPVLAVSINSPYVLMDIPWVPTYVCTYGYTQPTMEALAEVLSGQVRPLGRLPVSIPQLYPAGHSAG
jgi:beta-N-acetylhexosaminidase